MRRREEVGDVEQIRGSFDSLSIGQKSLSSLAPTPRAAWEAPTAWSVSESNALSEDGERLALGQSPRMNGGDGAGSDHGWVGGMGTTRRSSYRVLWDTLTKKQERKERTQRKQKSPVESVKATVLSLKLHPEAFETSVQLHKNSGGVGGRQPGARGADEGPEQARRGEPCRDDVRRDPGCWQGES